MKRIIAIVVALTVIGVAVGAGLQSKKVGGYNDKWLRNTLIVAGANPKGKRMTAKQVDMIMRLPRLPVVDADSAVQQSDRWLWTDTNLEFAIVFNVGSRLGCKVFAIRDGLK